ncbi:MAG: class I SAM-dependent methyltransferase [Pseudomonadota bacterium]|uniref:SAM-dependent methyltransferase n=1 Tax=Roseovarius salincola TaxID=2978479 RepID=UPI0022A8B8B4|nr:cyclopropane-fatty-acyl-phospholipid synthase family protein [Roseovarius sp. EGI FJ00037]MCZ0814150.1 cyclopropane-fatty-acyl-phospholipid synthase [Roseovarius sp. EGI FJ00037]
MLLSNMMRRVIRRGHITLIDARGRRHEIKGQIPGAHVTVRLHDASRHWSLLFNPQLTLGEAYMDGTLTVEDGDVAGLLAIVMQNIENLDQHWAFTVSGRWRYLTRRFAQANNLLRSRNNVAHHYDLYDDLFDEFLDADRFYSCAYFEPGHDDLERAQATKARHLAAKLKLEPGCKVLDIGSGWGSLGVHLAKLGAGHVDGVTLSSEQQTYAKDWVEREGLSDRVESKLKDYRDLRGPYDRIVSVGMFEHVGVGHFREYFEKVRDLLADDGVAVIHAIGRFGPGGSTNPWIAKYIFPGGYIPALSEVLPVVESAGLFTTDIEILRLHYAQTLQCWRKRFQENWDKVADLYDERFCRMWDFYLAASEMSFRYGGNMVFQIQLTKNQDTLPLTRDYITDWERAHPLERQ